MLLWSNVCYNGTVGFDHPPTSHNALHKTQLSLGSKHQLAMEREKKSILFNTVILAVLRYNSILKVTYNINSFINDLVVCFYQI